MQTQNLVNATLSIDILQVDKGHLNASLNN